jgi:hypothetical protein
MNMIEIKNLQAISGGCQSCSTHLDQAERALYIQEMRPTVIKEASISAAIFGGLAAGAVALVAGPAAVIGAGVATGMFVFQHEYNHHEIWN